MADSAEKKTTAQIDAINDEMSRGARPSASRLAGAPMSGPGSMPPSGIPVPTPSGNLQRALAELQRTSQPPPSVADGAPLSRSPGAMVPRPISVAPRPGSVAPRPMIPRPSQMPNGVSGFAQPPPETRRFGELQAPAETSDRDFAGYVMSSNTQPHGTPAVAPPPPSSNSAQPSTISITSPLGSIMPPGVKGPPPPSLRTPSPMAVVGTSNRSSLRLASPGTAMMPQSAPNIPVSSSQAPVIEAPVSSAPRSFGPPSGSLRSQPPAAARISTPPRHDSVPPLRPSTQPRSFMPASALARPATASKSFSPTAGGPPQQYERAFRQWSSPNITEAPEAAPAVGQPPVSFQVYTAKDVASGRGPMRSIAPPDFTPKKSSVALRFGMVLLAALILALTAAAVIAVSTEDPKKPVPAPTSAPPPPAPLPVEPSKPTVMSIGDDPPAPPTSSATAVPTATGAPVSPAVKRSILRPPSRTTNAPSPVAPPPNPYGK